MNQKQTFLAGGRAYFVFRTLYFVLRIYKLFTES
jgi:hypothetical protein